jgi:hypothetical protein
MKTFLRRFRALILGCLCGFDRMRFRGSKRQLTYSNGINGFLFHRHVLLRDFTTYAQDVTEALFQAVEPPTKQQGIYRYLNSSHISTEETALQIAAEHKQTQGLIVVLGRVEPCQTIQMRRGTDGWWMPSLHSGAKCLLLRGHGLMARVPKTHRYQVTQAGRVRIGALLAARHADTKRLLQAA